MNSKPNNGVSSYLLIEFQPSGEIFSVLVLQTEEPNFPQANSFHHLGKKKTKTETKNTLIECLLCARHRGHKSETSMVPDFRGHKVSGVWQGNTLGKQSSNDVSISTQSTFAEVGNRSIT